MCSSRMSDPKARPMVRRPSRSGMRCSPAAPHTNAGVEAAMLMALLGAVPSAHLRAAQMAQPFPTGRHFARARRFEPDTCSVLKVLDVNRLDRAVGVQVADG